MSDADRKSAGESAQRPAGRQTQRERREATVGKLLDATIDALYELGYARTSIQEICRRAGVSHGGLFRHFDTRLDLVVAAADEVGRRLIEAFRRTLGRINEQDDAFTAALRELRTQTLSPLSAVWHEVLTASRTDAELRERFRPAADRWYLEIRAVALELRGIDTLPPDMLEPALFAVLNLFDGAAVFHHVCDRDDLDQRILYLARSMVHTAQQGLPPAFGAGAATN